MINLEQMCLLFNLVGLYAYPYYDYDLYYLH
jgi:hypothetical protein